MLEMVENVVMRKMGTRLSLMHAARFREAGGLQMVLTENGRKNWWIPYGTDIPFQGTNDRTRASTESGVRLRGIELTMVVV